MLIIDVLVLMGKMTYCGVIVGVWNTCVGMWHTVV